MKTDIHTAELPCLPSAPKKRGRPSTGAAKTPAQRKADSRAKLNEWQRYQVHGPEDFRMITPGQIMDLLPRLWSSGDFEAVQWATSALSLMAETESRSKS